MGFPDRDKADQDSRAAADAADGAAAGERVRIKPPKGQVVRPPRHSSHSAHPPEAAKSPFTRSGGDIPGPVTLGDEN